MNKLITLIYFLITIPFFSFARTWTNYDGKEIEADFVSIINSKTVRIKLHNNGKNFDYKIENLSLDDRKFLKPLIKEYEDRKKALKSLEEKTGVSPSEKSYKIIQVLDNGLLVNNVEYKYIAPIASYSASIGGGGGVGGGGMARVAGSQVYFIKAYPNSGLVDGDFISGYFIENGTYSYNTVQNIRKTVRLMEYVAPAKKR